MKAGLQFAVVSFLLALVPTVNAQFVQDPDDLGAADTVRMAFTLLPDAATNQLNVEMDLYLFADGQTIKGASLGMVWDNSNLNMTDASLEPDVDTWFDFIKFLYRNGQIDSTNKYDAFQLTLGALFGSGIPASPSARHIANYNFTLSSWTDLDSIVFDTAQVLGAGFSIVDAANHEYAPYWGGTIVIYDPNRPILSNIVLSEDTLRYEIAEGQGNPPAQTVDITSDRDQFAFTVFENASWLLKTPSSGLSPQTLTVSVTTAGLAVGTYFDSIKVESAQAANSPQYIYAALEITPSPAIIGVSPASLVFSAVAGGTDPPSQDLGVSNSGGVDLNWSVSADVGWLDLTPLGGINAGTVTVTANIGSLGFGDHFGTITVSDPAATNDPFEIPVQVTIASDLPLIEVIDPLNQAMLPMFSDRTSTRTFEVRNGGEGTLSFTLSWSTLPTSNVVAVSPDAATAPTTVTVDFSFDLWGLGLIFYDTLWVHSSGAANSPQPVVFQQRVVDDPAIIAVPASPVVLTVYECSQGAGNNLPTASVLVQNVGGDNPMAVEIEYQSDLFRVDNALELLAAPEVLFIRALETDLPFGLYVDSIKVTSPWAANKPQYVVVHYDFRPGDVAPVILTGPEPLVIPYQLESGPMLVDFFGIQNQYGGCMPWSISATPAWMTALTTDGDVPGPVELLIEATGLSVGEHADILTVSAASAANSPLDVDCVLQAWTLRGDSNWNGRISLQDVALLIDFVFEAEHAPQPTEVVGDVNCDDVVDVTDVVLVIEYLFEAGQPLCGNPY